MPGVTLRWTSIKFIGTQVYPSVLTQQIFLQMTTCSRILKFTSTKLEVEKFLSHISKNPISPMMLCCSVKDPFHNLQRFSTSPGHTQPRSQGPLLPVPRRTGRRGPWKRGWAIPIDPKLNRKHSLGHVNFSRDKRHSAVINITKQRMS